jgi:hypothetical protein
LGIAGASRLDWIGLVVSIFCMLLPRSRYAKHFRDEATVSAKH